MQIANYMVTGDYSIGLLFLLAYALDATSQKICPAFR